MARGSITRYEGRRGTSWHIRIPIGTDAQGNPIHRRHTVHGTKREAEAKLRELLQEVDRGTYAEPTRMTLGEYLEKWYETHRQGLSPTTDERYRALLRVHLIPQLGGIRLQELGVIQIQEMANHLLREGHRGYGSQRHLAPKTVRDVVGLLRQALKQAVEWNLVAHNPADRVKLPRAARREPQIATEEQARMLLDALRGSWAHVPAFISYHTGMRLGEVLALS